MQHVENIFGRSTSRTEWLKRAIIAALHEPAVEIRAHFTEFTLREWKEALFWLDVSGMALYLLDRLTYIDALEALPPPVFERLQRNLRDNRERTDALFQETLSISRAFQENDIRFALVKGFALFPDAVPDAAFRFQIDIDFSVAEEDGTAAMRTLNDLGYVLHTVGGMTWEFRRGSSVPKLKELYQVHELRAVELHLVPIDETAAASSWRHRLTRAMYRPIYGALVPTLAPADRLLDQALHLFKHLCYENTRASWLLEFQRSLSVHRNDTEFWRELRSVAEAEDEADVALGAVTLLAMKTFGEIVPEELACWTVDRLPPAVYLWVEMYGVRALLKDHPGSKLYLILRRQLRERPAPGEVSPWRIVFPLHWPRRIAHANAGESPSSRIKRYRVQLVYTFLRLRFHVVEGLRYAIEARRWKRHLEGIGS